MPRHNHRLSTSLRLDEATFLMVLTEEINLLRRDLALPERPAEDVYAQVHRIRLAQRRPAPDATQGDL